ncbi:MAG: tetratricopeptide repeat protein [Planctomycetes bacterium]|nr:tetratricopeptide repeat protein [Planctomycetota bacterium]
MASGDITAQTFSSRKVCLARAREHMSGHAYGAAGQTLKRGVEQWPDFSFDPDWLTLSGHVAWRQERLAEAARFLRLAIKDPSAHVEARFLLGRVLLDQGKVERAAALLSTIANNENGLVPYRMHAGSALCVAYAAMGLNKLSQEAIEKAAAFGLISAQLLADEGYRLAHVGGFKEAEVQLAKALQIDSTCEEAFARLANVLYVQDKIEGANEVLLYAIEQSGEYLPLYRLLGEISLHRNKFRESAAFYKRCIEISPASAHTDACHYCAGQALQRGGFVDGAMGEYRDLVKKFPRSDLAPQARVRLGSLEKRARAPRQRRLEKFPRVLQKRNYCAPNTLANVLRYIGKPAIQEEIAARVMKNSSARWPEVFAFLADLDGIAFRGAFCGLDDLKVLIDKGLPVVTTEFHGMSGHALAITGYDDGGELVIAQDPRFLEPVEITYTEFLKGWAHDDGLCVVIVPEKKKNLLPAENPLVAEVVKLLEFSYEGRHDDAAKVAAELRAKAPNLQTPLRILAQTALERKDTKALRQYSEEALKAQPKCFWAQRHIGDACWLEGDSAGALKAFRKARKIDNRDEHLCYALGELMLGKGYRKRGRGWMLAALREAPSFRRARLRLAQDCLEQGDKAGAAHHARILVEYDPTDAEAKGLLVKSAGEAALRAIEARPVTKPRSTKQVQKPPPPPPEDPKLPGEDGGAQDETEAGAEQDDTGPDGEGDDFEIEVE